MSLHTKKSVSLKHSRAIAKGFSNKDAGATGSDKEWIREVEYRFLGKGRIKDNEVIEKTIHAYRMWFLFLKLGLELEEQNATLIMKHKRTKYQMKLIEGEGVRAKTDEHSGKIYKQQLKKIAVKQSEIVKKIKVKKSKYKGWDLDEVLTKSFDEWWQNHSHLFSDEICKVLDGKYEMYEWGRERISTDRKHLTLQIDTSLKLTDILNTVNKLIKERRKVNKGLVFTKQHKYSVSGSIHKDALLSKYNALVLKLENKLSNEEVLTHKDGYIRKKYAIGYNINGNSDWTRVVYGLLDSNGVNLGAKQLLVNVCNGFFMKQDN